MEGFTFGRGRGRFGLVVGGVDEGCDERGGGVRELPLSVAWFFWFGIRGGFSDGGFDCCG